MRDIGGRVVLVESDGISLTLSSFSGRAPVKGVAGVLGRESLLSVADADDGLQGRECSDDCLAGRDASDTPVSFALSSAMVNFSAFSGLKGCSAGVAAIDGTCPASFSKQASQQGRLSRSMSGSSETSLRHPTHLKQVWG